MTGPRRSRRFVLAAGAATGALLVVGPGVLAGCAPSDVPPPGQPDALEPPARRAESDAALARAVADAHPELAAGARALAADRQAHALALRTEIARVRPGAGPSSSAPPPVPVTAAPDQAGARHALTAAVRAAQQEAAELVTTLPAYRAALLASVAACCSSHAAVLP